MAFSDNLIWTLTSADGQYFAYFVVLLPSRVEDCIAIWAVLPCNVTILNDFMATFL